MPMRSGSGWTGIPWAFCQCHQKQYPVSMLKKQDGLIVCPEGFDNPQRTRTVDQRQVQIKQRLSDPTQEPELAEILKTPSDTNDDM